VGLNTGDADAIMECFTESSYLLALATQVPPVTLASDVQGDGRQRVLTAPGWLAGPGVVVG